MIVKLMLV